jgi:S1-C subfamily serine protease
MLSKGEVTAACVTGIVLGAIAGGCVVVIDRNGDGLSWSDIQTVKRPRLGVYLDSPSRTTASQLNIDRGETTVITDIVDDSPAERAGLQPTDIVTAIDGVHEADPGDLRKAIRSKTWGDSMTLSIVRQGQPMDLVVTFDPPESHEMPKY